MSTNPPTPRYRLTVVVEGNTFDEVDAELMTVSSALYFDAKGRDEFEITSGRSQRRLEHRNPEMTPDRYDAELTAWFAARKAAREDR